MNRLLDILASAPAAFWGMFSQTIYLENKLAADRIRTTLAVLFTDFGTYQDDRSRCTGGSGYSRKPEEP